MKPDFMRSVFAIAFSLFATVCIAQDADMRKIAPGDVFSIVGPTRQSRPAASRWTSMRSSWSALTSWGIT